MAAAGFLTVILGTYRGAAQNAALPPMEFGSPPPGAATILYNYGDVHYRHVYAKPIVLLYDRLMVAFAKTDAVLPPLRSMFEQLGGTVAYDSSTKVLTIDKSGVHLRLTIGRPEMIVNGKSSKLFVAPYIRQGIVYVPLRAVSQALGAYVECLAGDSGFIVVVRYLPKSGS